jgi:phosphatidylglycerophosphate synthase
VLSRWLLKLPLAPNTWSLLIFSLPICASIFLCRGTYWGFLIGCAIFQLYSILDGCDGEIARAKFLQTEFGRRLDSICDLAGNMLFALCLGIGLARSAPHLNWFYLVEGIAAAALTITSEGIVFLRRSRAESAPSAGRFHGALYQRHHEFFERSGILFIGENFAWWLVQLTKRDMAMLAFLLLAAVGLPAWNLHLLFVVGAISSALAGNAFLRQPAPAVPQEAS